MDKETFALSIGLKLDSEQSRQAIDEALEEVRKALNQLFDNLNIDKGNVEEILGYLNMLDLDIKKVIDSAGNLKEVSVKFSDVGKEVGTLTTNMEQMSSTFVKAFADINEAQIKTTDPSSFFSDNTSQLIDEIAQSTSNYGNQSAEIFNNIFNQVSELEKLINELRQPDIDTTDFINLSNAIDIARSNLLNYLSVNQNVISGHRENQRLMTEMNTAYQRVNENVIKTATLEAEANISSSKNIKEISDLLNKRVKVIDDLYKAEKTQNVNLIAFHTEQLNSTEKQLRALGDIIDKNKELSKVASEAAEKIEKIEATKTYEEDNKKIQEAINLINELSKARIELAKITKEHPKDPAIEEAVINVEKLAMALEEATSATVSNARAVAEGGSTIKETTTYREAAIRAEQEEIAVLQQLENVQNQSIFSLDRLGEGLKKAAQNVVNYKLIANAFNQVDHAISASISKIRELDTSMTQIQIVTGQTNEEAVEMMTTYSDLAIQLGVTTKQVADGSLEWIRQGKTISETTELLRASTMLSKIGNIEAAQATELLTAALNGFKMSSEEAITIVDKVVAADLNFATSSKEVATALQYVASSANAAGIDLDRMIGLITTVSATTRLSAETIGNSLKTIISRMQNVKIGKFIDDEFNEPLNDVEKTLGKLGISLRDGEDNWRSMQDVLDDVAASWDNFSAVEQSAIAVALGGTRQRNQLLAIFQNYDQVVKATTISMNSAGQTADRYGVYLDSIDAKISQLIATWEKMINKFNQGETFKSLVDIGTMLIKVLDFLINDLKIIQNIVVPVALVSGFKLLYDNVAKAVSGFNMLQDATQKLSAIKLTGSGGVFDDSAIQQMTSAVAGLSAQQQSQLLTTMAVSEAQQIQILTTNGVDAATASHTVKTTMMSAANAGATASTFSLTAAMNALKLAFMANPVGLILTAIATAASIAMMAISGFNQAAEESRRVAQEAATAYKDIRTETTDYATRVEELRTELKTTNLEHEREQEIKKELVKIQSELNQKYGEQTKGLSLVNGELSEQLELIEKINEQDASKFLTENTKAIAKAEKELEKMRTYYLGTQYIRFDTNIEDILKDFENIQTYVGEYGETVFHFRGNASEAVEELDRFSQRLRQLQSELAAQGADTRFIDDMLNNISKSYSKANEIVENQYDIFITSLMARMVETDGLSQLYADYADRISALNEILIFGTVEETAQAVSNWESVRSEIEATIEAFPDFAPIFEELLSGIDEASFGVAQFTQELSDNEGLRSYVEQLKEIESLDLGTILIADRDVMLDGQQQFYALAEAAKAYGLTQQQVVDVLEKVINKQQQAAQSIPSQLNTINAVLDSNIKKLEQLESTYNTLESAQVEFIKNGNISVQTLKNLTDNNLLQYLELTANGLRINTELLDQHRAAAIDDALQALDLAFAQDVYNLAMGRTKNVQGEVGSASDVMSAKLSGVEERLYAVNRAGLTVNQTLNETIMILGKAGFDVYSFESDLKSLHDTYSKQREIIVATGSATTSYTSRLNDATTAAQKSTGATKDLSSATKDLSQQMQKARSDIESLLSDTMSMLKQGYADQKAAIQSTINTLTERYNAEKSYLDKLKKKKDEAYNAEKEELNDVKKEVTSRYNKEKKELKKAYDEVKKRYDNEKKELNDLAKEEKKRYDDAKKELKAALDEETKAYNKRKSEIAALKKEEKAMYDANKQALKDELDARNKIWNAQKQALKDQLDGYKNQINAELELLKLKDEQRSYDKELTQRTDELSDLQNKLFSLGEDTSIESQKRRIQLLEQIAKKQTEIDELQYQRGLTLQEQALQDELERYEEQINDKIDQIQKEQDAYKEMYETRVSQLEAEHNLFVTNLEVELELLGIQHDAYRELYDARISQLEGEYEKFQENHESTLEALEAEFNKYKSNYDARIEQLELEQEKFLENWQAEMDALEESKKAWDKRHQRRLEQMQQEYESEKTRLEKQMKDIEDYVSKETNIRKEAIELIEGRSKSFYDKLIAWNREYGTHVDADVIAKWNSAYAALDQFNYKQIGVQSVLETITIKMSNFTQNTWAAKTAADALADSINRAASAQERLNSAKSSGSKSSSSPTRYHDGAKKVTKKNTVWDEEMGVKPNETLAILEVGEGVIKKSDVNNSQKEVINSISYDKATPYVSPIPTSIPITTSKDTSLMFNFGDINIENGDREEAEQLKKGIVREVFDKMNKQYRLGGFGNVKVSSGF